MWLVFILLINYDFNWCVFFMYKIKHRIIFLYGIFSMHLLGTGSLNFNMIVYKFILPLSIIFLYEKMMKTSPRLFEKLKERCNECVILRCEYSFILSYSERIKFQQPLVKYAKPVHFRVDLIGYTECSNFPAVWKTEKIIILLYNTTWNSQYFLPILSQPQYCKQLYKYFISIIVANTIRCIKCYNYIATTISRIFMIYMTLVFHCRI